MGQRLAQNLESRIQVAPRDNPIEIPPMNMPGEEGNGSEWEDRPEEKKKKDLEAKRKKLEEVKNKKQRSKIEAKAQELKLLAEEQLVKEGKEAPKEPVDPTSSQALQGLEKKTGQVNPYAKDVDARDATWTAVENAFMKDDFDPRYGDPVLSITDSGGRYLSLTATGRDSNGKEFSSTQLVDRNDYARMVDSSKGTGTGQPQPAPQQVQPVQPQPVQPQPAQPNPYDEGQVATEQAPPVEGGLRNLPQEPYPGEQGPPMPLDFPDFDAAQPIQQGFNLSAMTDWSPSLAYVDSVSQSNLLRGYKRPQSKEEKEESAARLLFKANQIRMKKEEDDLKAMESGIKHAEMMQYRWADIGAKTANNEEKAHARKQMNLWQEEQGRRTLELESKLYELRKKDIEQKGKESQDRIDNRDSKTKEVKKMSEQGFQSYAIKAIPISTYQGYMYTAFKKRRSDYKNDKEVNEAAKIIKAKVQEDAERYYFDNIKTNPNYRAGDAVASASKNWKEVMPILERMIQEHKQGRKPINMSDLADAAYIEWHENKYGKKESK